MGVGCFIIHENSPFVKYLLIFCSYYFFRKILFHSFHFVNHFCDICKKISGKMSHNVVDVTERPISQPQKPERVVFRQEAASYDRDAGHHKTENHEHYRSRRPALDPTWPFSRPLSHRSAGWSGHEPSSRCSK